MDPEQYKIEPISPQASPSEIRRVSSDLFRLFQRATFDLIEAERERDKHKTQVDDSRAGLTNDIAKEELAKRSSLRLNSAEKVARVDAQLRPQLKRLAEAETKVRQYMNIIWNLRFQSKQVEVLSMLSASERKFGRYSTLENGDLVEEEPCPRT